MNTIIAQLNYKYFFRVYTMKYQNENCLEGNQNKLLTSHIMTTRFWLAVTSFPTVSCKCKAVTPERRSCCTARGVRLKIIFLCKHKTKTKDISIIIRWRWPFIIFRAYPARGHTDSFIRNYDLRAEQGELHSSLKNYALWLASTYWEERRVVSTLLFGKYFRRTRE